MRPEPASNWTDGTSGESPPSSAAAQSDLPPMEDAAELIAKPIDLPPDVVEGLLHRAAKMVLGGASKTFKTWTLIDLAVSVATGTDFLGKFPTQRGRVLYINLELQGAFFANRLRVLCDERQLNPERDYLKVWNLRGKAADLFKLRQQLLRGRDEFVLMILDPVYKLLGRRDENKAGDIASLLNEIEALTVETDAAAAFGAHYSKGNQAGKEVIDRIGGSGVFARDPDSILNFTKHEQEDCFTVDATLRNHPPIKSFVVRWEYPLMSVDVTLNPTQLKQPGRPELYHADDLLKLIDQPMKAKDIVKVAHDELDMPRRRVFELLADLKASERLNQPQERGEYEPV
jgi:RecA-family ATPase